ncbi:MAG: hypothetical protein HYX72_09710 [Acidobacteria bacterium]|nr:hypothetical protein [Acidobacteriota bacterium]
MTSKATFAWDVNGDGKTAVRGGGTLLYEDANLASALSVWATNIPPYATTITIQSPSSLTIPFSLPAGAGARSLRSVDYNLSQSHMLQYNLTVERQLPMDMAVSVAYAASRGFNLTKSNEGNPTVPQVLADSRLFWTGLAPTDARADSEAPLLTAGRITQTSSGLAADPIGAQDLF